MAKKADAPEAPIEREVRKLRKLIKNTRIAMFTTVMSSSSMNSPSKKTMPTLYS